MVRSMRSERAHNRTTKEWSRRAPHHPATRMTMAPTIGTPYVVANATIVVVALDHSCSMPMSCPQGSRRADGPKGSVPVAFDIDPAAWPLFPPTRGPLCPGARPRYIVALDPDILTAVPSPVTRLPVLDLDALARQDRNDLDAWRRRR